MLTAKAKTRLMKLVEFMESLPRSANAHFDMRSYFDHEGEDHHRFPEKLRTKDLHKCGTTACALGWAATMPYFKRLGLSLDAYWGEVLGDSVDVFDMHKCEPVNPYDMWRELFSAQNQDSTPKQWARRVRRLIREWERAA